MKKPSLWYPPGAGGMWLNYLLWCIRNNTTMPGSFDHFEYANLRRRDADYISLVEFIPHTDSPDADIVLGSNRAWMNFYLNIVKKKQNHPIPLVSRYTQILLCQNIKFNLEWCDIWENPEKFVHDLAQLSGYQLQYNKYARTAIEQYRQSCVWVDPSWYNNNQRILLPTHCRNAPNQIKTSTFWTS
jgi:hypothetical protein